MNIDDFKKLAALVNDSVDALGEAHLLHTEKGRLEFVPPQRVMLVVRKNGQPIQYIIRQLDETEMTVDYGRVISIYGTRPLTRSQP